LNKIQVTLTVEEGKEIIALGILKHPLLLNSIEKGKVVFKGGTTVSKITEKLLNLPLRISGRITTRGTVSSLKTLNSPHSILLHDGKWKNIDDTIADEIHGFSSNDLIICGANAFDFKGRAALMAGSPGGGNIGKSISSWYSEGASVIIPVGIEKMIPGDLDDIIKRSSRTGKSLSWGMAVGLIPLYGEIFTEVEAIKMLADVDCYVIGAGGLGEAQGSTTLEINGSTDELEKLINTLQDVKSRVLSISGDKESLVECAAICDNCSKHLSCGYKRRVL
jgi:hypothetical protein